ncbi:MAG: Modification methylase AplI [Nitrospira sp.]|nr:Modification methylase AplI [Nitrospira sp.]
MPSWTIQARRSNNMGPFHWRNRILTIAEVKRLQTFPDDFQLAGTIEQQWRQIGNAVPPRLAFCIATEVRRALSSQQSHAKNRI